MSLDVLAYACANVQKNEHMEDASTTLKVQKGFFPFKTRAACHRCGNIRKEIRVCPSQDCPHIFCRNCHEKVIYENAEIAFKFEQGCAMCLGLCCCLKKSESCTKAFHCYRKCPVSKILSMKDDKLHQLVSKRKLESIQLSELLQNKRGKNQVDYDIYCMNSASSSNQMNNILNC
eukprot:gene2422-4701_t